MGFKEEQAMNYEKGMTLRPGDKVLVEATVNVGFDGYVNIRIDAVNYAGQPRTLGGFVPFELITKKEDNE